uniref:Aquaporin n=1 Tax=Panagrolaimus sp. JU765 TaxID=591449 RepID=A0AC34RLJ4_9BILA
YTGFNVNAQKVLGRAEFGNYTALSFGWGLAIMFSVQLGYNISGSHMNPAVSLLMYSFGHLSLGQFFLYVAAQISGAFFASALTFLQYYGLLSSPSNDWCFSRFDKRL